MSCATSSAPPFWRNSVFGGLHQIVAHQDAADDESDDNEHDRHFDERKALCPQRPGLGGTTFRGVVVEPFHSSFYYSSKG